MICNGVLIAHFVHADDPKAGGVVCTGEERLIIKQGHESQQYGQELLQ